MRLRYDGRRPRRWHAQLVARLAAMPGLRVEIDPRPSAEDWPGNADLLFRLEALLNGIPADGPAARLDPAVATPWPRAGAEAPDLILDLCGDVPAEAAPAVWRLAFDGMPGEIGLLASLLDNRVPVVALFEGERPCCAGRLGTEVRGLILTAFEDGLARTVTLIQAAVAGHGPTLDARPPPPPPIHLTRLDLARRGGRMLARGLARRLYHLCYRAPHWRVGWRRLRDGPDLIDLRRHPGTGWTDLPDDGLRFYADPFAVAQGDGCVLFVEDYIHATGKAVISALRFGPEGPVGRPEPVLEEPHHLSYPFVFAREGAHWMVPESCANGTIDLYRATAFPGGWVKQGTLVEGVAASDATLLEHGGRWWLFATVRHAPATAPAGHGSYSDTLHLWTAPDFRGPWTPHPKNPVLIDIASARPAGPIVSRGGKLIRPIQDCTFGYGNALALARIDRLDLEGFSQTVETRIAAGPLWAGTRLHTLSAAGGYEFIDGSARVPRLPLLSARA
ncbi:formyl transferase [Methylobacterium organophilum]|uniref:glucosamine inositolphosphorylceramide transferase family protein n=1 Tax=Methylobacterium organophilum TaxID=410 RepID=UPI00308424F0